MPSKPQFTILCPHCDKKFILVHKAVPSRPPKVNGGYDMARAFIQHYQELFLDVISTDPTKQPHIDIARVISPTMKAINRYGVERLVLLLQDYLQSPDDFYEKNGWSLELFLSTTVLNKLNLHHV